MLHHRTEDVGIRASHIAAREAEAVRQEAGGDGRSSYRTWKETFDACLMEFTLPEEIPEF